MEDKQLLLLPTYGDDFLVKHAGKIVTDPNFAIVELVANAWDAGAMNVKITWPTAANGGIRVEDDGTGMTEDEFKQRWLRLNYNRLDVQGKHVTFPPNKKSKKRMAFGRNGIGRHAMFSFSDEYFVETCNAGKYIKAAIKKSEGDTPYQVDIQKRGKRRQHGTSIYISQSNLTAHLLSNEMSGKKIADLIGSRFIARVSASKYVVKHTDRAGK